MILRKSTTRFHRGHRDEDGHRSDRSGQTHEHRKSVTGGSHFELVTADQDHVALGHDPQACELHQGATAQGRQTLQWLRQDAVDALGQGEQENQEPDRRPDPAQERPAASRKRQAGDHRQECGRLCPFSATLVAKRTHDQDPHERQPAPPRRRNCRRFRLRPASPGDDQCNRNHEETVRVIRVLIPGRDQVPKVRGIRPTEHDGHDGRRHIPWGEKAKPPLSGGWLVRTRGGSFISACGHGLKL